MIDDDSVLPALAVGARGYLLKDAGIDDVLRGIEAVAAGQSVLALKPPSAASNASRSSGPLECSHN
ncbi:MAG: hypothetical protein AVDCRST_MAG61-2269 [uncultured Friedmanniella sp.]|uniref:Two-component transcriptional response regulator, LuxR family n=1 Tax=uncultured Friedmanniella sp. TaxID=335381 RepID=A0A6J4L2N1_9ACTN|nr:hypothetical protein [uncultured Friedmanniella sp.]CAA9320472.1 MAG: hypothetical protein AVDCRST_MAG61-2269 [uncultured Friedmanniella sp.]